jgi:tetratricopeptide (TPR) repeat protein
MSAFGATVNSRSKVGRNDACPCGSGRKYKHCCKSRDARADSRRGATQNAPSSPGLKERFEALALAGKQHGEAGRWAEAVIAFRELVGLMPELAEARSDLGIACLALGRLDEAAANLQRAVELRPSFELALVHLASVLLQLGRDSEALVAYRRLSRRAADPLERRRYLAQSLAIEGKWDEAEKEFRRLLAQAPSHAEARRLLAELLSERGMLDEAAQHLAQAAEVLPAAFQRLTIVKRMTEADRPLIERVRANVERLKIDLGQRLQVHFGLGKAFEDLGDYAEAIQQYDVYRPRFLGHRIEPYAAIALG